MSKKEIHFIYGALAAKKWVHKIANSNSGSYKIFYQAINKYDLVEEESIIRLPLWVKIKFEINISILWTIPSLFYILFLLSKYRNSRIIAHMSSCIIPLIASLILRVDERIYFSHGFANIDSKGISNIGFLIFEYINIFYFHS